MCKQILRDFLVVTDLSFGYFYDFLSCFSISYYFFTADWYLLAYFMLKITANRTVTYLNKHFV